MIELLKKNKWVAIGIVVLLMGVLWFFLNGSSGGSGTLLDTSGISASASGNATIGGVDQELRATLEKVRGIQLADPVLSDPVFHSLQDFGQQIVPEPFGRPNPFAPLQ